MTRGEALDFLRRHQPLPSDEEVSRETLDAYDEVRKHFLANPDPEAVPLLLNSFGEGSGFGVYQLIEDVVAQLPRAAVVPHIAKALGSQSRWIRYWNAQIAARSPDPQLVPHLALLLREPDHDLRYAAITALEQIDEDSATAALEEALGSEKEGEIRDLLLEILSERKA